MTFWLGKDKEFYHRNTRLCDAIEYKSCGYGHRQKGGIMWDE